MSDDRRLIEDFLPIDTINAVAGKEKKHPQHPVALIHYWPARRPITASRAAVFAALVSVADASDKDELLRLLEALTTLEPDPDVLERAKARIAKGFPGRRPIVLDMFAGGGAIPLEAARLGCESHAVDYSPVAYLIEMCTLVYPQRYGRALANDVSRWGKVVLERLRKEVGDLYPSVSIPKSKHTADQSDLFGITVTSSARAGVAPVTYIWVRAVPCRRPGCGALVPLVRQSWLRKRGGVVAAVPQVARKTKELTWTIASGPSAAQMGSADEEQTGAGEAQCLACTTAAPSEYVKQCASANQLTDVLAAVAVDGGRSKLYLAPDAIQGLPTDKKLLSRLEKAAARAGFGVPTEPLQGKLRDQLPSYGFETFKDLFTLRQQLVLLSLCACIRETHRAMIVQGVDAERARAVTTYLAMAFGRLMNSFTRFCRWQNRDQITIAAIGDRQALKWVADYSEINPFAETAGCLQFAIDSEVHSIQKLAQVASECVVTRGNAEELLYEDAHFDAVITDPPYYSSIFYADLSAFFYVWLKRLVGDLHPEQFAFATPPKRREAVAQASEHAGDADRAAEHYRRVMEKAFKEAARVLKPGAPLVCVYAHKTTEGWASLIKALVPAGFTVTEAWPVQTEAKARTNALAAAALSDSIFFVARKMKRSAVGQYESEVKPELQRIAKERVEALWANGKGLGGADLLMAAVGAGLRAYTQYERVEYSNGEEVTAEQYLRDVEGVVLDTMLANVFGLRKTGVSGVDSLTSFYVLWRFTYRESPIEAGEAFVFAYPQGIEIDGPAGVSGPAPALVEKAKSTFRVRDYADRGDNERLGLPSDGVPAPVIDALHRTLWLMENKPRALPLYLREASPNLEQMRLVAQALCGPVLSKSEVSQERLTGELSALTKLTANWDSVVGMTAMEEATARTSRQRNLSFEKGGKG